MNQRAVVVLVGQVQGLSEAQRTVAAKSVDVQGNLFETEWRDNVLGPGGIVVKANGKDFAGVSAVLDPSGLPEKRRHTAVTWLPSQGVQLLTSVKVNVTAKLKWHFDPLITGGVGNDVSVGGEGTVPVTGTVRLAMDKIDGQPVALIVPTLSCVNVPVEMKASGEIKLGVKTGVRTFDKPISPMALLDNQPRRIFFDPPKTDTEKAADIAKAKAEDSEKPKKVRVVPKWKNPAVDIVTLPTAVSTTPDGFLVVATLASLNPAKSEKDPEASKRQEDMGKKLDAYARTLPAPACPEKLDLRIIVGDVEIGPNNELLKLGRQGLEVLKRASEEGKKIFRTPGKALEEAPANIVREVTKGLRKLIGH